MPPLLPLPPVRGGAVESLVDLLLRENATEEHGHNRFCVFGRADGEAERLSGNYSRCEFHFIPVHDGGMKARSLLARGLHKLLHIKLLPEQPYLNAVLRMLRHENWDAVIAENVPAYVPALLHTLPLSTPVYLHLHNRYIRPGLAWSGPLVREERLRILAISDFIRREALQVEGADPGRVYLLPNCIDTERFDARRYTAARAEIRARLGIPAQAVVFLFTGRLLPEKGVRELLQAFLPFCAENGPTAAHLLIVGGGWFGAAETPELSAYRRELAGLAQGWEARIHFSGMLPYAEMPAQYAAADVAVLPSLWEEPSGLTVLEALSSGLPLITTASGGIRELISPACALTVPRDEGLIPALNAAMARLAQDAAARAEMGVAARAAAAPYGAAAYYEHFISLLARTEKEAGKA